MAMKKAMIMKVAVLALLLAVVSANTLDFFELLTSNNQESLQLVRHKKPNQPCCDKCICTKSNPPQCSCWDLFIGLERCKTCENCLCTRSAIPQCRCADVTDFCYPKCKPKAQAEATATLAVEIASSD